MSRKTVFKVTRTLKKVHTFIFLRSKNWAIALNRLRRGRGGNKFVADRSREIVRERWQIFNVWSGVLIYRFRPLVEATSRYNLYKYAFEVMYFIAKENKNCVYDVIVFGFPFYLWLVVISWSTKKNLSQTVLLNWPENNVNTGS